MKIMISGYQIIQDAQLLIDGITMVTGSNNHGKSAIVRAVESCLFSEQGDEFINDEMGVVQVRLIFEAEQGFPEADIKWEKGRGTGAIYHINGERYAKERGKPPVDIMSSLGFRDVVVRDRKQRLYFWRLHDGLFMVVDHPSYVFGFISNLMEHEKIVPVLKEMAKEGDEVKNRLKDTESKCQVYETEIENTRLTLEELKEVLDSQEEDIQMIEDGVTMLKALETYQSSIEAYNKSIKFCSQQIEMLSVTVPEKGTLEEIKEGIERYESLMEYRESLSQIIFRIKNLRYSLNIEEKKDVPREELAEVEEGIRRLSEFKSFYSRLSVCQNNIDIVLSEIKQEEGNLVSSRKSFEKLKKGLGVCPLCGKEF